MCTAITLKTNGFYFGRTLDYDFSFGESVTVTPRLYPFRLRNMGVLKEHYAIIGMAHISDGYPLYYDGVNEKGLAAAGLNFTGFAHYSEVAPYKDNLAQFELIPWLLGKCATVKEAVTMLKRINITATPFSPSLPPAELHWIFADKNEAVTLEAVKSGIKIHPNPVGVLTNNPTFPEQLFNLNNYINLSPYPPENRFSKSLSLNAYSNGMGAIGLPGDLSSQSRFVRAAFIKSNSVSKVGEKESVSQFFHILDSVSQPRGCTVTHNGKLEITQYSSCINTDKGIYYYTTYENRQINAVFMNREKLDTSFLISYPLSNENSINEQN